MKIHKALDAAFPVEFDNLKASHRTLVVNDFKAMLAEEYDTPDDTMDDFTAEENIKAAASEYRRRIGRDNLASYCASLAAGVR